MKNTNFTAFGVSESLKKLLRRTSSLEIVFGTIMIAIAGICFALFLCCLGHDSWGKEFLEFIGYDGSKFESGAIMLFSGVTLCSISSLVVGVFALVSGINAKSSTKNPVSLINAKIALRTCGIFYGVFALVVAVCFFVLVVFWPLLVFGSVILVFCLVLSIMKFVETKSFPDKTEILDVRSLSPERQKNILNNSSLTEFEKNEKTKSKSSKKSKQSQKKQPQTTKKQNKSE